MQYPALCRDDKETRIANLPVGVKGVINLEFWVQNLKGTGFYFGKICAFGLLREYPLSPPT